MGKGFSMSIVMHGDYSCNMNCAYCCTDCQEEENIKSHKNDKAIFDFDKLLFRIDDCYFKNYDEHLLVDNKLDTSKDCSSYCFDIWGGEPLFHLDDFKKLASWLRSNFKNCKLHTSTNGLILSSNEITDYIIDNKIFMQISHDGLGQNIRSKNFDPLFDPLTKDNVLKIVRANLLDMINCSLGNYNPSIFNNIEYFNKWRFDNHIEDYEIEIKMNHMYNSDDYVKPYNLQGKSAKIYCDEFERLAMMFKTMSKDNKKFSPYMKYINGQIDNVTFYEIPEGGVDKIISGACRSYQMGLRDYTFVADTIGNYCQCNLLDSSMTVKNPEGKRPDECKDCEFTNCSVCLGCGSMPLPAKCDFNYSFVKMALRVKMFNSIIDKIHDSIYNGDYEIDKKETPKKKQTNVRTGMFK